jgi:hypothetical protein
MRVYIDLYDQGGIIDGYEHFALSLKDNLAHYGEITMIPLTLPHLMVLILRLISLSDGDE